MKRFEEIEVLGDGAFGVVKKCRDKENGELVAIKKMKQRYATFDECLQLKEVKSLRKIKHTNVERLLQVFRENEYLYLVFELLGKSLLKTINDKAQNNESFTEDEVRNIVKQLLVGLAYVHKQGFFHRDIKPDNLLWKGDVLKLADFGLAREIRSRPPYTEYISTRWYRAPEIILRSPNYNSPVDIWAAGCIMAELYLGHPIFQGLSEQDQMYKIVNILGTPNQQNWPDFGRLVSKTSYRFPPTPPTSLGTMMPNASPEALDIMQQMLLYDPAKRPSATQALNHPFFRNGQPQGPSTSLGNPINRPSPAPLNSNFNQLPQGDQADDTNKKKIENNAILQPNPGRKPPAKSALNRPMRDLLDDSNLTNDIDDILKEIL